MLTTLVIFLSFQGITRSKVCELNRKDILSFEISYQSSSAVIEANSPDAKLVSCKPWKEFPNLLVAEIDLGSSTTNEDNHDIQLLIFDTLSKELKEVFRKKIREEKRQKKGAAIESLTSWENPYRLEKTKDGKPAIRMVKSAELVKIN